MLVTEAEAKGKQCRAISGGVVQQQPGLAGQQPHALTIIAMCAGTACMHWQWGGLVGFTKDWTRDESTRGFCGLSGPPQLGADGQA